MLHFFSSGTKHFIVSVSESGNGPWEEIKSGTFVDPRQHEGSYNPQDSETFEIDPVMARYVKFSCTRYYGNGCALQYIEVFGDSKFMTSTSSSPPTSTAGLGAGIFIAVLMMVIVGVGLALKFRKERRNSMEKSARLTDLEQVDFEE